MKTTLLIIVLQLTGCASISEPEQYFYSQDLATMADRDAPGSTVFTPGHVPAVIVAGADYYGKELRIEVWREKRGAAVAIAAPVKRGRLQSRDAFCYWYSSGLPAGDYLAQLFVDGAPARHFEFSVVR